MAGAHVLTDLGSTSGTTVNGTKLAAEHLLREGDLIGLGEVELRYERA
jgi:pSer/pThr/pTyr-binding forkhead associated (FHA) protein